MLKVHIEYMSENGLDIRIVINNELIEVLRKLTYGHLNVDDISPEILETMSILGLILVCKENVFISIQGKAFLGMVNDPLSSKEGLSDFFSFYYGQDYKWYYPEMWSPFQELLIFMRSGPHDLLSFEQCQVDQSSLKELCDRELIIQSYGYFRLTERGKQASDLIVRSMLMVYDSNYDGSEDMYRTTPFSYCR